MSNQIVVPTLGESITEATVSKWLKQVGDKVDVDEPVAELETDKVNLEISSPCSGTLSSIKQNEGSTVEVGSLLGTIKEGQISSEKIPKEGNNQEEKKEYIPPKKQENEKTKKISKKINLVQTEDKVKNIKKEEPLILDTLVDNSIEEKEPKYIPPKTKQHLSPAVRKLVDENDIDVATIEGTGKGGRISKEDLLNLMGNIPKPSKRKSTHGPEERVKMTRLRVTIAKRLKEAQDSAAMLTTFQEVDMQSIMKMRQDYQDDFKKKYDVRLGYMSFFVKASVVALKNFPAVNAEIEGNHIIYKNYYNISIAIGTDRGLVVPTLKKADELSFANIEKNIFLLSEKAKNGKITLQDLQGGTFTISNGGIYGSMLSTPILNPPQTGILGMHNIIDRPVAKDGQIVIRPIMYLALSYDHRIIDGKEAVSFLKTIKECLEEPRRLFLDI
tara:strand:+ start:646 stop:1974 length:1329 start_codon:yes stop_codon:yes gene_type:complete